MSENDRPFPLLQRFEQLVLPPLLLSLGIFLWSVHVQNKTMGERVYVELERHYLQTVLDDVLLHDDKLHDFILEPDNFGQAFPNSLSNLIQRVALEPTLQDYLCIEFVRLDGRRLAGMSNDPSCQPLAQTVIVQVAMNQRGTLIEDFPHPGVWTVVAPLQIKEKSAELVAVVTKSSSRLKNNHHQSFKLWAAAAFLVLSFAVLVAWLLIRSTQKLINQQVLDLISLRNQISRYVSGETVRAVMVSDRNDLPSSRSEMTLLFMDVRHFSSYAETATLDDIVTLLSDVTSVAITAVADNGGDVNKVIGDGVMATFNGSDRQVRALQTAVEIVENISSTAHARSVGIGVHDGEVITATLGRGKRRDHTVLGRTVNQASRLCSMAGPGEIIVTADTIPLESVFQTFFGSEETAFLKGHADPLRIRKYTPSAL